MQKGGDAGQSVFLMQVKLHQAGGQKRYRAGRIIFCLWDGCLCRFHRFPFINWLSTVMTDNPGLSAISCRGSPSILLKMKISFRFADNPSILN